MFGIGQDKGGSSGGYTGTLVFQSFFVNTRIIFDADGAATGLAGQKKPDPSLAAAIVQQNIAFSDPSGSSQAFQNGIGRGLIGIPVLVGAGIISSSSFNAKEAVPTGLPAAHLSGCSSWCASIISRSSILPAGIPPSPVSDCVQWESLGSSGFQIFCLSGPLRQDR